MTSIFLRYAAAAPAQFRLIECGDALGRPRRRIPPVTDVNRQHMCVLSALLLDLDQTMSGLLAAPIFLSGKGWFPVRSS